MFLAAKKVIFLINNYYLLPCLFYANQTPKRAIFYQLFVIFNLKMDVTKPQLLQYGERRVTVYDVDAHLFSTSGQIGISLNQVWPEPKDPLSPADVEAAERSIAFYSGWFGHPILVNGDYPEVSIADKPYCRTQIKMQIQKHIKTCVISHSTMPYVYITKSWRQVWLLCGFESLS